MRMQFDDLCHIYNRRGISPFRFDGVYFRFPHWRASLFLSFALIAVKFGTSDTVQRIVIIITCV